MPWLLALHIIALICWCGALLYLPALTAITAGSKSRILMARALYTHVASPLALLAIVSGVSLLLMKQLVAGWLIAKLTLVSLLVLCHVLNGRLIFHMEIERRRYGAVLCSLLGIMSFALISGILWLVLAKPF